VAKTRGELILDAADARSQVLRGLLVLAPIIPLGVATMVDVGVDQDVANIVCLVGGCYSMVAGVAGICIVVAGVVRHGAATAQIRRDDARSGLPTARAL